VGERDAHGRPARLIGTNVDITRRKRAELLLEHQAGHDALTGLPNRRLFHDRLTRAMARSRRHGSLMALLCLDIDRFKHVNDTLGHDAGDTLLKTFSKRLTECVRETDTVARLGGDEFTVILEELNGRDDGCQIAQKIVAAMRPEFVLEGRSVNVSTSVGIAFYHGEEGVAADDLIKKADVALYQAKAAGRDQYRIAA
jgi:diguanylate cyclase (GGDEF)-like protein